MRLVPAVLGGVGYSLLVVVCAYAGSLLENLFGNGGLVLAVGIAILLILLSSRVVVPKDADTFLEKFLLGIVWALLSLIALAAYVYVPGGIDAVWVFLAFPDALLLLLPIALLFLPVVFGNSSPVSAAADSKK